MTGLLYLQQERHHQKTTRRRERLLESPFLVMVFEVVVADTVNDVNVVSVISPLVMGEI